MAISTTYSPTRVLSSKEEGSSDWTSVAAFADGGYVVAWHDGGGKDGDRSGIYARRYDASDTQIGDEIQVNTRTEGYQSKARVAATSDGHFMVVWADHNGSLQGQIFNPDSTPSGEQFTVGPWYNAQADIIGTSDNQFAVVRMQTNQHTAMLSVFDTDGTQVVGDTFLSQVRAGEPRVIELEPGRFLSVWYDMSNNSGFEIWGQTFDASGTLVGDAFVLNSTLANNQQAPEIVATGDGGFAAVWQSFEQDGDLFDIYFRLFDDSGAASSDEILINQSLTAQQIKPSIERSSDGTLIVAWESYHLGAAQIFVQRLSPTGVLLGDNELISVDDSGQTVNGTEVDLATLANGSVLATWDVGGTVYSRIVYEAQTVSGSTNTAPVLTVNTNVDTLVDTAASAVAFSATDSDADDLSFSFSEPKYGDVTIHEDGTFTYTPDEGYVGSDQFVISVSDGVAQAREVVRIDVRPPNTPADWSELQIISPKSDGGSDWTSVASLPGGGFVVVWHDGGDKDGDRSGIYARLYDANYQRLGDEFQVNSKTTDFQTKARVASTPDGHFMVVWAGGDGSLQAQVFDSVGAKQGAQFTVGPWFVAEADIQGTSDNKFVVVRTQNNENAGILAVYSSDGTELVNNVALSDVLASEARVIELIDGRLLASWWDGRNAEGTEIYGRYFDATGTLLSDAFKLNQTLANNQQAPEIVALESGGFAVVWQSEESEGGTFDIYARLFDADGNATSDDILVSDGSTGQQVKPAIELASDGTLVIAWESNHLGSNQIVYQTLSSDGEKKGTNQVASQTSQSTNLGGTEVALATLEDGSVLATWDIGGDVYGRILHQSEPLSESTLEIDLSAIRLVSGMGNLEDIDVFANGKYFITRWASDGSGNAQGFQIADPDFENITTKEVLNNYTDSWQQFGTSVLVDHDQMLSTWDGSRDPEGQPIIPAQITDSAGNIVRDDFAMSESLGGQKQVIFKDGVLYIASSTGGDVLLSTYDGNRDFSLVHSQVINAPSDYLQSEPDIALIDDSHLVIAYQSNTDPTAAGAFSVKGDSDIRFAIYDLLTQEQSVDFVIAQSGAIGLKEPQVAAIGEGRFLITWTETTYDDAAIATHFAQAYSADGSAISDAIEVANYTLGPISPDYPGGVTDIRYAVDTALTAGPSGTAIFAWNQHDLYHSVFDGGVATLELNGTALQLTDKQLITAIDGDSSAGIREPVIYTHPTDGYGVIFNNTPDTALIVPVLSKVDQIAPSIPEIYVVAGDDVVTVDELAGVTVGGTAEPGSTLQLTSNYPDSPVFETIVDLNGKWLFEYADFGIEGTLVDGSYELYATATDAAGNTSDVTTRLVEIDLVDAIEGTTGADTLIGTAGNDEIFSYAGNDFIEDGLGDDYVYAGIGDDTINNIGGTDYFDGGDGVDTLITDVTQFAAGDFVLGFNAIEGTHGRLNSDIGQDTIVGIENFKARGSIDTNIVGDSSANVFETDAGNDTIQGGSGNDTIYSGQGDDSVYGGSGDDVIYASDGRDFEDGGEGNDTLAINGYNTSITDVTYNLLEGSQGITGGPLTQNAFANFENFSIGQTFWGETIDVDWNLTIVGTDDANRIQTSEGNDTIIAGGGNDTLLSGGGNDTIDAGEGLDDVQYEGLRSDYVLSQSGNDVFVSSNLDGSVDTLRNVEFISFGGNGERMTIEEALTGNPVSGTGLSGQVYQWSSHYLLPDVSITGGGLTSTFSGPETDPRFKITNIRTLDGVVKADVVLDAKAALVDNFTLNVKLDDGVVADLTANADLQSSGWQTVSANVEGGVSFGGFALSTNLTGEHVVAELTLGGSADASNLVFTIADSAIGADASETLLADYEVRSTVFQASTTQAGDYLLSGAQGVSAPLDVSKNLTATDEGRVISAADALAALKIAVGLNPNLNSSGEGFATSSYQYLAADVNEDGRVSAADALAILKMAVKLDGASEREWVFLREDAEITNPDGTSSFSRSSVDWSETDTAIGVGDAEVNFVGLLRGDVNGSWSDDTLNQLDVSYFDGFANAEQWWVV